MKKILSILVLLCLFAGTKVFADEVEADQKEVVAEQVENAQAVPVQEENVAFAAWTQACQDNPYITGGAVGGSSLLVAALIYALKYYLWRQAEVKEEIAKNFSLGFTAKLSSNLNATIDAYHVSIEDRIILSGNFDASSLGFGIDNVQFFANGVDTKTSGLDIVLNWNKTFDKSKISVDLSGNINYMKINKIKNKLLDKETFFGKRDQQFLLASAPKSKFNFGVNYEYKKIKTSKIH